MCATTMTQKFIAKVRRCKIRNRNKNMESDSLKFNYSDLLFQALVVV